jgi:signal peptidase I
VADVTDPGTFPPLSDSLPPDAGQPARPEDVIEEPAPVGEATAVDPPADDPVTAAEEVGTAEEVEEVEEDSHRSFWRELPMLVLIALVIAVLIKTFLLQAFWIPSSSMENTLQIDDRVLVNKLAFDLGDIQRGDVVVFDDPRGIVVRESVIDAMLRNLAESVGLSTPKSEFIKRVIALEGETVQIADGRVLVDGVPIDEPYLHPSTKMFDFGPDTVPDGHVFVMGDNRNRSQDSRSFGAIEADTIVGKAFVVIWPPDRWSGL